MKALFLDALGTLLALEPPVPHLREELAARFGIEVSEAQAADAIAAEIAYYRAHLDEGRDARSLAELRACCAQELRAALPQSDALAAAPPEELQRALLASLRFNAYEDAGPALRATRAAGRRVVVVSNWDVSLHDVLDRVGLAPLLDGVITSAQTGSRKPAREIFTRGLELARVSAGEALHVGDSLAEDVEGARGAGIEPVLIARDGGPGPPGVHTIRSLLELCS